MGKVSCIGDTERLGNLLKKMGEGKTKDRPSESSPKTSYMARKQAWESSGKGDTIDVSRLAIL